MLETILLKRNFRRNNTTFVILHRLEQQSHSNRKKSIFWEDFYEAGPIYLGDLFDSNGSLRTFQYWVCKGVNPGRFLQLMSLIDSVPRNWISAIKGKDLTNIKRSLKFDVTKIRLDRNTLSISSLNSKRIYTRIVFKKKLLLLLLQVILQELWKSREQI